MNSSVVRKEDAVFREIGPGVKRRVLAWTREMMTVEIHMEAGGTGSEHTHPHAQSTYVRAGAFDFTVEGQVFPVREGDTLSFAPGERHGCVCREAGTLIDVFAPMREDFL